MPSPRYVAANIRTFARVAQHAGQGKGSVDRVARHAQTADRPGTWPTMLEPEVVEALRETPWSAVLSPPEPPLTYDSSASGAGARPRCRSGTANAPPADGGNQRSSAGRGARNGDLGAYAGFDPEDGRDRAAPSSRRAGSTPGVEAGQGPGRLRASHRDRGCIPTCC